ncbi:MAG TPA: hypothetical protein PLU53_09395 [Bacteroidia bacterium]|nr:hypothetical protein [Bacteroidia bacterium]
MKTALTILILLQFNNLNAQIKKQSTPAKENSAISKPEIDRLYEKYKKSENKEITLFTPFGELKGNVNINYNADEKPESITISGSSYNKEAIAQFIADFIEQKLKNNYKDPNFSFNSDWEFESIKFSLGTPITAEMYPQFYFTKGKMYTKIKAQCTNCGGFDSNEIYEFEIETGDRSRFGGKTAEKFDF